MRCLLAGVMLLGCAHGPQPGGGAAPVVSYTIVDATTGQPLQYATVSVIGYEEPPRGDRRRDGGCPALDGTAVGHATKVSDAEGRVELTSKDLEAVSPPPPHCPPGAACVTPPS